MSVYRVNKTRDFTVMGNTHLRDKNLSLKAVGLLSKMLSFNDGWQFSTRGLAALCKEGPDAILSALKELEENGYLVRHRGRDDKGRMVSTEFDIYEMPQAGLPHRDNPHRENPDVENPDVENPHRENPAQRNTITMPTKPVSTPKRISVLWQTTSTMNAMVTTSLMMNRDASPMKAMSASQANAGTGSLTVSWTIFPTNTGSPAQGKTPSVTAPSPFSSLSRERSLM